MPRAMCSVPWPSGEAIARDHVAQVGDAGDAGVALPVGAGVVACRRHCRRRRSRPARRHRGRRSPGSMSGRPTGPMKPGRAPVAARISSSLASTDSPGSSASLPALTSLISWSPRRHSATRPSLPFTSRVFTHCCGDTSRKAATSSMVFWRGRVDALQRRRRRGALAGRAPAPRPSPDWRRSRSRRKRRWRPRPIGQHLELVAGVAADGAGIGLHGAEASGPAG